MNALKTLSICISIMLLNICQSYAEEFKPLVEPPKQHLELSKAKKQKAPYTGDVYLSKLQEATKKTIESLQQEINPENKDIQLSTEYYMKRIDELFYDTPQGKIYKKYGINTYNILEISQALDIYSLAIWKATDLLQYRMALEKNGKIELKYAISPYVVHKIFQTYSTQEYSAKILSFHDPRNIYNIAENNEISILQSIQNEKSPILKFLSATQETSSYYSVLLAQRSCLKCHGKPKDEFDAYNFKKEGYALNDKIGVMLFSFHLTEKDAKKEETKKN